MERIHFTDATVLTVTREQKSFSTFRFNNFEEAKSSLAVNDLVIANHNCNKELMRVYSINADQIVCNNSVNRCVITAKSWIPNKLEKVESIVQTGEIH